MMAYKRSVLLALSLCLILALTFDSAWAQNLGTSSYQYVTEEENTIFNEWLSFATGDTFFGPVHCNYPLRIIGTPFSEEEAILVGSGPPPSGEVIFVDGYLELEGIMRGVGTIGASGNPLGMGRNCIRMVDDVRYWFADSRSGIFNDSTAGFTDMFGIVSEGDIVVGKYMGEWTQQQRLRKRHCCHGRSGGIR